MHRHAKPRAATSGGPSRLAGLQPACGSSSSRARRRLAGRQRPIARSSSSSGNDSSSSSSGGAQVSVAVSSSPEPPAAASRKDALAALRAKAQAYKQQGAAAATSSSTSDQQQQQPAETLSEEQQAALRQQFLQTLQQAQAQTASQASDYNRLLQQQQQQQAAAAAAQSPLDKLAEADPTPGARPPPARPDFYTNPEVPAVSELLSSAPKKAGTGSADEAADWLKGVLAAQPGQQQLDPNMRPEEFSAAKEAVVKGRGAEIITAFPADFEQQQPATSAEPGAAAATAADGSTAAAAASPDGEQASGYKPKVTTWGVFPRPQNISQAYGGGRDIRPGQDLETPQQKAAREAEYAAALQRFKKATFTDSLSDAELAAARSSYDEAMVLFKRGAIPEALALFDQVRETVPLKSRLGGLSTLQAAVCYDTLGNARQAEALYKRIRGHPTAEVSRKAKQLVFGFQAMAFLKTADLDYAALSKKKEEYAKYFRRSADRNRLYLPSEEQLAADKAEAERAAAVALGVVLGPVLIMGALLVGLKL